MKQPCLEIWGEFHFRAAQRESPITVIFNPPADMGNLRSLGKLPDSIYSDFKNYLFCGKPSEWLPKIKSGNGGARCLKQKAQWVF